MPSVLSSPLVFSAHATSCHTQATGFWSEVRGVPGLPFAPRRHPATAGPPARQPLFRSPHAAPACLCTHRRLSSSLGNQKRNKPSRQAEEEREATLNRRNVVVLWTSSSVPPDPAPLLIRYLHFGWPSIPHPPQAAGRKLYFVKTCSAALRGRTTASTQCHLSIVHSRRFASEPLSASFGCGPALNLPTSSPRSSAALLICSKLRIRDGAAALRRLLVDHSCRDSGTDQWRNGVAVGWRDCGGDARGAVRRYVVQAPARPVQLYMWPADFRARIRAQMVMLPISHRGDGDLDLSRQRAACGRRGVSLCVNPALVLHQRSPLLHRHPRVGLSGARGRGLRQVKCDSANVGWLAHCSLRFRRSSESALNRHQSPPGQQLSGLMKRPRTLGPYPPYAGRRRSLTRHAAAAQRTTAAPTIPPYCDAKRERSAASWTDTLRGHHCRGVCQTPQGSVAGVRAHRCEAPGTTGGKRTLSSVFADVRDLCGAASLDTATCGRKEVLVRRGNVESRLGADTAAVEKAERALGRAANVRAGAGGGDSFLACKGQRSAQETWARIENSRHEMHSVRSRLT